MHPSSPVRDPARSAVPGVADAAAINRAALLLAPVVRSTPLKRCERLSVATGAPVLLKREDTQVVRSYKVRGAYNLITSLPVDARQRSGVRERRQPRAGRRVQLRGARHPRPRLPAGHHPAPEARSDPRHRRQCGRDLH